MSPLPQYADTDPTPERSTTGQVTDHVARLEKVVAVMADAANRLEHRLAPVLATDPEDGAVLAELAAMRPARVPLAEQLGDVEGRLDRLVGQLEGLIRRCEL